MTSSKQPIKLGVDDIKQYILGSIPFARVVHDQSAIPLLNELHGNVVELGASVHDYSKFCNHADSYTRTNLIKVQPDFELLDATDMHYEDESVDCFVCFSVLEHIYDYQSVFAEAYRCLKPNGRLVMLTPWMFPYHGAPDDYFRFSISALEEGLKQFEQLQIKPVGGYWVNMAMLLQRPIWAKGTKVLPMSISAVFRRFLGTLFLLADIFVDSKYDEYAMLYQTVAVKNS